MSKKKKKQKRARVAEKDKQNRLSSAIFLFICLPCMWALGCKTTLHNRISDLNLLHRTTPFSEAKKLHPKGLDELILPVKGVFIRPENVPQIIFGQKNRRGGEGEGLGGHAKLFMLGFPPIFEVFK